MPKSSRHRNILQTPAMLVISLCGVGFLRPASGTWGSLAAGIVLFFIFPDLNHAMKMIVILTVFFLGWLCVQIAGPKGSDHDPYYVVIDEAVGMMITTFFLQEVWWHFALAIAFFRIFDVAKLWPASVFDQRTGSFDVMFDDVLMALPALACLHLILSFL